MIKATSLSIQETRYGIKIASADACYSVLIDHNGYWRSFRNQNHFYQRALDNRIFYRHANHRMVEYKCANLLSKIQGLLQQAHQDTSLSLQQSTLLEKATLLNEQDYQEKQQQYIALYRDGVPILPPDHYHDLVIEPASGCPYGKCQFCTLYRNKAFSIKSEQDFAQHLIAIEKFFATTLNERQHIFLSAANALAIPQQVLLTRLQQLHTLHIPIQNISSFYDPFHAPRRDSSQWHELRESGLQKLIIGLETAHIPLRQQIYKSIDLSKLHQQITQLKQQDFNIGLTLLIGIGGLPMAQAHLQDTVAFIKSLPLETTDQLYLSSLTPCSEPQHWLQQQLQQFKFSLQQCSPARCIRYNVQNFFYR